MSVYNTTIYFIYFKIVYHQGDIFRPSPGHPQALKENRYPRLHRFFTKRIVGSQMLTECIKGTVQIVEHMCL